MIAQWMTELKQEYELEHQPNNPLAEDWKIGLSEAEWSEIVSAKNLKNKAANDVAKKYY